MAKVARLMRPYHRCINKVKDNKPKKQRTRSKVVNCPHTTSKHYAKGMCDQCYHIHGRTKRANNCEHSDKLVYAQGMCVNCYQRYQRQKRRVFLRKLENNPGSVENQ